MKKQKSDGGNDSSEQRNHFSGKKWSKNESFYKYMFIYIYK